MTSLWRTKLPLNMQLVIIVRNFVVMETACIIAFGLNTLLY